MLSGIFLRAPSPAEGALRPTGTGFGEVDMTASGRLWSKKAATQFIFAWVVYKLQFSGLDGFIGMVLFMEES
jgi:hypothetical protein